MNRIAKAYKKFCDIELAVGAVLLISTVFILTFAAILRTIGFPINWGLDLALLMFTWSVYVGADTALRDDKMVNVEIFQQFLKPKTKKILQLVIYILILLFLFLMVYYGFYLAYSSRFRTFQGIPFMSYTWATLSMPIPSVFMIITTCLKIRNLLKNDSAVGSKEVR
ncbi:TRAP transporter small permease [Sphaerochaeta globosa]|uniref:Tripartite ATP-independent periplasmic transporter DctQ component n=1 Tax=Sphaerochaeta globosa (strain ATCC BAA-1886 / DSM 22777 / Buddy) TaxID=158189 RepID=F0RWB9_SPHGB|nr:TRAP transporter small permease [Sphaerochaeta globosa]ADY13476.1 Tripartite ATP-independent periplasmic transporter DctQ component [Sphaerochaeta globosa str. Buddy]